MLVGFTSHATHTCKSEVVWVMWVELYYCLLSNTDVQVTYMCTPKIVNLFTIA